MAEFPKFMASMIGRIIRILAGIVLMAIGLFATQGLVMYTLVVVGLIPFLAGILDVCLFAPLLGQPLQGNKLRGEA